MSYYTVHAPFHSKPEKTKKYADKAKQAGVELNAKYAGMVESLDENVGRMLDWLEEHGLRRNTIVVLTSDNGGHRPATSNRPLRGHKGDLYEGGIRVPYIIDWPGVMNPGSVCNAPVHGVDFSATLLAMTGLQETWRKLPACDDGATAERQAGSLPHIACDSVNLVPLLKGDTDFDRGPMFWHYPVAKPITALSRPGSVIRVGDWKFIQYYDDGREELYNLKDDIGETSNLARSMPEKAAEMKTQLDAVLEAHNATIPTSVPEKPSRPARKKRAKRAEK